MKALFYLITAISSLVFAEPTESNITNQSATTTEAPVYFTDPLISSSTRGKKKLSELDQSVSRISQKDVKKIKPKHPSEILNSAPGVHVNNLGGEGHMTAIRQPISTSGMYLFLEDGVPTRPSGYFNHNGLYEINIPQANNLEIIRGPGSSLYGSDAVAGTINANTRPSPLTPSLEINPEFGSYGWSRVLFSGGSPINDKHGFRADINLTKSEGFRENTDYSRNTGTLRFDGKINSNTDYKTILTYSGVNQSGASALSESQFNQDSTRNLYSDHIADRNVNAFRFSTEVKFKTSDSGELSVIPFYRDNKMELMPPWMMTYDPNDQINKFSSVGAMLKFKTAIGEAHELHVGLDYDRTESNYFEKQLLATKSGAQFVSVTETGRINYDFDAAQTATAGYLHSEFALSDRFVTTLGLRSDHFEIDYTDNLDAGVSQIDGSKRYYRPVSQKINFTDNSPKVGLIYKLNEANSAYGTRKYSFRIPSVGQLFRSGSSVETEKLNPINSYTDEIGVKGKIGNLNYELSAYQMLVQDEVVSYIDGSTRKVANAGQTTSTGLEVGAAYELTPAYTVKLNWSKSSQKFDDFKAIVSNVSVNFSGKTVPRAPNELGGIGLVYNMNDQFNLAVNWEKVGSYYVDEYNTNVYNGHDLTNVKANYQINDNYNVDFGVTNVFDRKYSVSTSSAVGSSNIEYTPGSPLAFVIGLTGTL